MKIEEVGCTLNYTNFCFNILLSTPNSGNSPSPNLFLWATYGRRIVHGSDFETSSHEIRFFFSSFTLRFVANNDRGQSARYLFFLFNFLPLFTKHHTGCSMRFSILSNVGDVQLDKSKIAPTTTRPPQSVPNATSITQYHHDHRMQRKNKCSDVLYVLFYLLFPL